jgi:hypothetical protein
MGSRQSLLNQSKRRTEPLGLVHIDYTDTWSVEALVLCCHTAAICLSLAFWLMCFAGLGPRDSQPGVVTCACFRKKLGRQEAHNSFYFATAGFKTSSSFQTCPRRSAIYARRGVSLMMSRKDSTTCSSRGDHDTYGDTESEFPGLWGKATFPFSSLRIAARYFGRNDFAGCSDASWPQKPRGRGQEVCLDRFGSVGRKKWQHLSRPIRRHSPV